MAHRPPLYNSWCCSHPVPQTMCEGIRKSALSRLGGRVLVVICFASQQSLAPNREDGRVTGWRCQKDWSCKCPGGLLVSAKYSRAWRGKGAYSAAAQVRASTIHLETPTLTFPSMRHLSHSSYWIWPWPKARLQLQKTVTSILCLLCYKDQLRSKAVMICFNLKRAKVTESIACFSKLVFKDLLHKELSIHLLPCNPSLRAWFDIGQLNYSTIYIFDTKGSLSPLKSGSPHSLKEGLSQVFPLSYFKIWLTFAQITTELNSWQAGVSFTCMELHPESKK